MSLKYPLLCIECKSSRESLEDLIFVTDDNVAFCSEVCIQKHFKPLTTYLDKNLEPFILEHKEREEIKSSPSYLTHLLQAPDHIIRFSNELTQYFYVYTKNIQLQNDFFTFLAICFCFSKEPSYLLKTEVVDPDFLNILLEEGEVVDNKQMSLEMLKEGDDFEAQELSDIEQKKSHFLSILLTLRAREDIALEHFIHYEKFLDKTIYHPEQVIEWEDESGDDVIIYIKTFEDGYESSSFLYYVISTIESDVSLKPKSNIILSFPSNSSEIYKYFVEGGKVLLKNLKN